MAMVQPVELNGMELKATTYEVDGHVAVVTLNRPHRHNAWTGRMHAEYRACLAEADSDPNVRAAVVTGAGTTFCVGADTDALSKHAEKERYDDGLRGVLANPGYGLDPTFDHHFAWHFALRIPVIAAINGACAGVGLVLACYADIRFVASDAKLTTAASKIGIPAEFGLSWLLPKLIGLTRANDLLLSSRVILGTEAESLGLVNAAMPRSDVLPHSDASPRRLKPVPLKLNVSSSFASDHVTAVFAEEVADIAHRPVLVVGSDLHHHRRAARPVPFVADLLVIIALLRARAAFRCALDGVARHVVDQRFVYCGT